jgi:hypothetical protein
MDRICNAHDCNNINRRKLSSLYCSPRCAQKQKRFRKENKIGSVFGSVAVSRTGNLLDDVFTNASMGLISGAADPVNTVSRNVVQTCVPYALEVVRKRPIISFLAGLGAYMAANHLFTNCTTTTTTENGETTSSESCKKATSLQKTGTAIAGVLGTNFLIDNILGDSRFIEELLNGGRTGVSASTNPVNTVNTPNQNFQPIQFFSN